MSPEVEEVPPSATERGELSELARRLHEQESPIATLEAITHTVLGTVPGAEYAGVTVVESKQRLRTVAATGELVTRIDQAQYRTGQGPCLDALWVEPLISMPDLRAEQRWPKFTAAVQRHGLGSMLSLQAVCGRSAYGVTEPVRHFAPFVQRRVHRHQPGIRHPRSDRLGLSRADCKP